MASPTEARSRNGIPAEQYPQEQAARLQGLLSQLCQPPQETALSDVEVSPREIGILITLGRRGDCIMSDLATAIHVPLSTATRIVDRLESKGIVERSRSEHDRRIVVVRLSALGRMANESCRQQQLSMAERMLVPLSRGEREILIELMEKMAHSIEETPGA